MFSYIAWRLIRSQSFKGFISLTVMLSVIGTALGVAVLITITSIMNGFDSDVSKRIYSITDHIRIYPDSTHSGLPLNPVVKSIKSISGVESATPYAIVPAVAIRDQESIPIQLIGLPNLVGKSVSKPLSDWLKNSKIGGFEAINTTAMKEMFSVSQGDKLITMMPAFQTSVLGINVRTKRIPINKTIPSTMPAFDRRVLYMHLEDIQTLKGSKSIEGFKVHLKNPLHADDISSRLKSELGDGYRFETWVDAYKYLFDTMRVQKVALLFVFSLVIVIASFSLICGLVMMVNEKRTNIAVLLTLGMTPRQVRWTFIVLGLFIATVGLLFGTLLGVLLSYNATGLCQSIESFMGIDIMQTRVFLLDYLPSEVRWLDVMKINLFSFIVSFFAVLYPAYKASNVYPAKVLRYE
jgi:lipoprotein-releasing system permease protein